MGSTEKADFLAAHYSSGVARTAAENYGAVEDMLAESIGQPVAVMISTYEQDAYFEAESDKKLRFVSHFRNTSYEFGIITEPQLAFNIIDKTVDLVVSNETDIVRLADLAKPRTITRRDVGRSLTRGSFQREQMVVPGSVLLLPRIQIFAGMSAIEAFLDRPEYGKSPKTQSLFYTGLLELGVELASTRV